MRTALLLAAVAWAMIFVAYVTLPDIVAQAVAAIFGARG